MAEVEKLLAAFKKADKECKGTIGRFQMAEVLKELDEYEWSHNDLFELFEAVDTHNTGEINYKKFINYLLEADLEIEEEEESEEEDDDADELENADEAEAHHLDLTQIINLETFQMIATRMGEDPKEAAEIYHCICKDEEMDGLDVKDGIPLEDIIDAFGLSPNDHQGLTHLTGIITEVLEKLNAGEHDDFTAEEKEFREKVLNCLLDQIVRHLDLQKRPMDHAWDALDAGEVPLTKTQLEMVDEYKDKKDEFIEMIKETDHNPKMLGPSAGKHANNEMCYKKVGAIIDECTEKGIKFTDPDFPLTEHQPHALYVDKEKPGYDCTVGLPSGYKRLSEIIGGKGKRQAQGMSLFSLMPVHGPTLFKGGVRPGDIIQGQIGTCFFLGALGAVAANNPKCISKCFIKYDIDIGVYGVRFNLGGEWVFEIIDDYVPVDQYGRVLYSNSLDKTEMWVALLEKAFCKHHTCYEMCDGGLASEAIFTMFGGSNGKIKISKKHREEPSLYFQAVKHAIQQGWLLTTTFVARRNAVAGQGKCGEAVLPGGLVGGHVYSILEVIEAEGNQLIHIRNPWGTGEWKGKWSDGNAEGEWTEAMTEAAGGAIGANDGKFWMDIKDFVSTSGGVDYSRTFTCPWKKISQYKHFLKARLEATALWGYTAGADDEITFQKGQTIEVGQLAPGWWYGNLAGNSKKGFFPGNYVSLNHRPVSRFDATASSDTGEETVQCVVMLVQPNVLMQRKFYKRKQDGLNYKEIHYPSIALIVVGPDGELVFKKRANKRMLSKAIPMKAGVEYKIYTLAADGLGEDFMLRVYVKSGALTLHEAESAAFSEISHLLTSK